jgi:hypothetical protein
VREDSKIIWGAPGVAFTAGGKMNSKIPADRKRKIPHIHRKGCTDSTLLPEAMNESTILDSESR